MRVVFGLRASVLLFSLSVGFVPEARADDAQATAAADLLFEQGRALMKEGGFAEACPKLAESLRLDPALGTQLYLADCYEKNGQSASAWALFREAAQKANRAGQADREAKAVERAQELEGKLVRLTIQVTDSQGSQRVTRDGEALGPPLWGTAVPVDPGTHVIASRAAGFLEWSTSVDVSAELGTSVTVTVPALQSEPAPVAPVAPVSANEPVRGPVQEPARDEGEPPFDRRILGIVIGGVGVVGVGIGVAFGVVAQSKNNEALEPENCPTETECHRSGIELTEDAKSAATVSTVTFVVGTAAIGAGVLLFLTAESPESSTAGVDILPALGPGMTGLVGRGRF